jgi:Tol biopolymer transport system component
VLVFPDATQVTIEAPYSLNDMYVCHVSEITDLIERDRQQAVSLFPGDALQARKLTSLPTEYGGDSLPRFSPDGKTLAFDRSSSGDGIFVLPVSSDGSPLSEPRRLTHDERLIFCLDWTADGRSIVYSYSVRIC